MKKYILFLFCLSIYAQFNNLYALSCPNTKVSCVKSLDKGGDIKVGDLFGGKEVDSYWKSTYCHPEHKSQKELDEMCWKAYKGKDCKNTTDCTAFFKRY